MRLQNAQARFEREQEAIAPLPGLHRRRMPREVSGELLVQGDDHRLLTREIPVQQAHADVRVFGYFPQRRGLVAPLADHPDCGLVQAISCCRALRRLTRRTPTFSALDSFSEHVHYY